MGRAFRPMPEGFETACQDTSLSVEALVKKFSATRVTVERWQDEIMLKRAQSSFHTLSGKASRNLK